MVYIAGPIYKKSTALSMQRGTSKKINRTLYSRIKAGHYSFSCGRDDILISQWQGQKILFNKCFTNCLKFLTAFGICFRVTHFNFT